MQFTQPADKEDLDDINRRQVYKEMMNVKSLSLDEVNEEANLYFKSVDKGQPDWDRFD